jgi:hypothetical protein
MLFRPAAPHNQKTGPGKSPGGRKSGFHNFGLWLSAFNFLLSSS